MAVPTTGHIAYSVSARRRRRMTLVTKGGVRGGRITRQARFSERTSCTSRGRTWKVAALPGLRRLR
eukprot:8384740-Pyramimonas_sp.AAC.1